MSLLIQFKSGDDAVTLSDGQLIGFFGSGSVGTFGESIPLDAYNRYTAVTNSQGIINYGALPNVRYVSSNTADIGSGAVALTTIPSGSCTLHIHLTSGSTTTRLQAVRLIAYDNRFGIATGPFFASVKGFEYGSSTWTTMSGSSLPLVLTPHTGSAQLDHDYYVGISASPAISGSHTTVALAFYAEWY
jgi:hypothetical protein